MMHLQQTLMLPTKRQPADQYLQKVGGTYYARVTVPRTLRHFVGQTHLRRSLKTGDRAEANRRKLPVVVQLKAALEALRKSPPLQDPASSSVLSYADATKFREALKVAEDQGDEENRFIVQGLAEDRAEAIASLFGHEKATKWHRAATVTTETLADLMTRWLDSTDYRESTKSGHRKSLSDVLAFMGDEHAHPVDVTRKTALAYIDNDLTQSGLAHATMQDRLVSLGGFWKWMAARGIDAASQHNPWSGHRISRKQHQGRGPKKRTFTDDELLSLLRGIPRTKAWPTYRYLPDLLVLGMYTGARIESLCSLTVAVVAFHKHHAVLSIGQTVLDKNVAGTRFVGITHPAPLAVLRRRADEAKKAKGQSGQLFPELHPGGYDKKFSAAAVKAFGRYRRACGVPDGTDFHSYRRNVISILMDARVHQVPIAQFVGHKVGTMAADVYARGASEELAVEVAGKVRYSDAVEAELAA